MKKCFELANADYKVYIIIDIIIVIVLLCLERVGDCGKGRGRDRAYFSTKTVLHDTSDFSLLSFNVRVCYAIYVLVLV